ncbi:hypothetical protein [Actinoplanes xinjiangensis]|uniref:hypothetical protein n=1 Tax=Actinoplanes xinjiangensis TaxID=512350 RepID=UPI000D6A96B2|nr:hypothetical protein [Actinoplanes xinjiangensis]GIF44404.1 hypothetical protein Axi01nite_87150 [Actinoplanes xinjiangensis]
MTADASDFRPVGPGWLIEAVWGVEDETERHPLIGWTRSDDGARWLPTYFAYSMITLDVDSPEAIEGRLSVRVVPASASHAG